MPSPVEREFLDHAAALRALARDLVGEQYAEDLVQDTAVEALRRPPRRAGPLGGWLASIVRHLASKHRRGQRRRQQRERLAARSERVPPDHANDDRDSFRRLTQAVLALPEPYQTTLLLRYLRDLSPTEIAAQSHEPVRTVKTRLQRGLALLREGLDRDGPDWRAGFGTVFGLGRLVPGTAAAITAGVLLMGTGAKLVFGGAAAAAALVAALWIAGSGQPEAGVASGSADEKLVAAAAAATQHAVGAAQEEPGSRREVAADREPTATDPTLATIRGRCVDERGQPLAGATAHIEARQRGGGSEVEADLWRRPADQTTADDGLFAFRFPVPAGVLFRLLVNHVDRSERSGSWQDLERGSTVDLGDVVLLPAVVVTGRVVDTRGRTQAGVRVQLFREIGDDERTAVMSAYNQGDTETRADGAFGPVPLPGPGRGWATVDRRLAEGPSHRFTLEPGRPAQLEIVVVSDEDLPPIRGVVVDEAGQPIRGASVALGGAAGVFTAADGAFVLRPTSSGDGPFPVRVQASGFEDAESGPHPLGTDELRIVLRRSAGLLVHVLAADTRKPVTGFAVDLISGQRQNLGWRRRQRQQEWPSGIARLPGVHKGPHYVYVDPGQGPLAPSTFVPVTIGDAPTTEVTVELHRRCERRLRLRAIDGASIVAAVELIDTFGLPLRLHTEAFAMDDWDRFMGPTKVVLLQRGSTDATGELLLHGPAGQDLALRLRGTGIALQTVAPVRLDGDGPLEVTVQRGAVWTGRLVPADVAAELFAASQPQTGQQRDKNASGIELWHQIDANEWAEKLNGYFDPLFTYDAEGRFRVDGVPAGTWQVNVFALGRRYHCDEITVGEGRSLEHDLDVAAMRLCTIDLQVFVDGSPLAEGRINVLGEHAADHSGQPLATSATRLLDPEGRVQFRAFGGVLALHVYAGSEMLFAPHLIVPAGGRMQRVVEVQRARLSLRLLTPDGQPAADVPLQIGVRFGFHGSTDPGGHLTTSAIAAGRYSLRVRPRTLGDQKGQAAHARLYGWAATNDAWIDLGPIDVTPGTNPERVLRLPPDWDR